ncbi:CASP-like protein 5B2 isoform X2 [Morus notabilis]|uniref:CASP-like protein 5B2 isoform X2 n=1 Tax=Morus notabilis TaxID=981085 RepID=UPI000CED7D0B|nr:CASP-like protein 5B2 isoform X2 [Morus notabilis]
MKQLVGRPGSGSGLVLRLGQASCAAASIGLMVSASGFATFTAFCYLIASMGLQVLWSFGLACLDIYGLRRKRDLQNPILVSLFVVGDWVTATLSLAAASSSAGIVILYARDMDFCSPQFHLPCARNLLVFGGAAPFIRDGFILGLFISLLFVLS